MKDFNLNVLVVMGLSPTGLHVVREAGRSGVYVVGFSRNKQSGCYSKFLDEIYVEADEDIILDIFLKNDFSRNGLMPVIIPTSDQDVDFIIKNSKALAKKYIFQESYKNGVAYDIMTKEKFYYLCEIHNVDYPKLWTATLNNIEEYADRIRFPCLIKPSRIHDIKNKMNGKKGWIAKCKHEFADVVKKIPNDSGVLIVQEIVPGPDSNIKLFCTYRDGMGHCREIFSARKLRQYPPGFGSASVVQGEIDQDIVNISECFLRNLNYEGIASIEYKIDSSDKKIKIIEINVRPSLWFSVTSDSNKYTVLQAYFCMIGKEAPFVRVPQLNNVRWIYRAKDIWSAFFYRKHKDFILGAPDLNSVGVDDKRVYPVWRCSDPIPFFYETFWLMKRFISRKV